MHVKFTTGARQLYADVNEECEFISTQEALEYCNHMNNKSMMSDTTHQRMVYTVIPGTKYISGYYHLGSCSNWRLAGFVTAPLEYAGKPMRRKD